MDKSKKLKVSYAENDLCNGKHLYLSWTIATHLMTSLKTILKLQPRYPSVKRQETSGLVLGVGSRNLKKLKRCEPFGQGLDLPNSRRSQGLPLSLSAPERSLLLVISPFFLVLHDSGIVEWGLDCLLLHSTRCWASDSLLHRHWY